MNELARYVSEAFDSITGRILARKTHTEFYSGEGTPHLLLRQYPVPSVTDVWLDGGGYWGSGVNAFATATKLTNGTDYALMRDTDGVSKKGVIARLSSTFGFGHSTLSQPIMRAAWPEGQGNIKVVYAGGYHPIPADLEMAAAQGVIWLKNSFKAGGFVIGSESLREASYSLLNNLRLFPLQLQSVLARYRRASF